PDPEPAHHLEVACGERMQLVRAEQAPRAHPTPVGALVATEIAQVETTFQLNVPRHVAIFAGGTGQRTAFDEAERKPIDKSASGRARAAMNDRERRRHRVV